MLLQKPNVAHSFRYLESVIQSADSAEAFTKAVNVIGSHGEGSPTVMMISAQWQFVCSLFYAFVYVMDLK